MFMPETKASFFAQLLFIASVLLLTGNRSASADYYKYTDTSGAVCITNSLESVPPKYRSKMKVIREETLDKKDRAARVQPRQETSPTPTGVAPEEEKAPSPEPASFMARLTSGGSWKKPVLVVGGIVCLFLLVRKLSDHLPSALLARLIYLAFFLGTFVFLYKSYAEHVTNSYFTIKTKVISMFEKSNRREAPESPAQKLLDSQ